MTVALNTAARSYLLTAVLSAATSFRNIAPRRRRREGAADDLIPRQWLLALGRLSAERVSYDSAAATNSVCY